MRIKVKHVINYCRKCPHRIMSGSLAKDGKMEVFVEECAADGVFIGIIAYSNNLVLDKDQAERLFYVPAKCPYLLDIMMEEEARKK